MIHYKYQLMFLDIDSRQVYSKLRLLMLTTFIVNMIDDFALARIPAQ